MRSGLPVMSESANEVRRIWPPPSPYEPSICNHGFTKSTRQLKCCARRLHFLTSLRLIVRHGFDGFQAIELEARAGFVSLPQAYVSVAPR